MANMVVNAKPLMLRLFELFASLLLQFYNKKARQLMFHRSQATQIVSHNFVARDFFGHVAKDNQFYYNVLLTLDVTLTWFK